MTGSERRTTQRFSMRLPLTVRWTTGAAVGETMTESRDVSSRGVGVISANEWMEDDVILVSIPAGRYSSAARVAHCVPIGSGQYRTGLEFIGAKEPLQMNALTSAADPSAN